MPITVAIPTYRREQVLIDTVDYLLALEPQPTEILILDQTEAHEESTSLRLTEMVNGGIVRWERLTEPSIPKAMNQGLLRASQDIVLFLDDDIRPELELLAAHLAAHESHGEILVAGRVIQPWEEDVDFSAQEEFGFAGLKPAWIDEFMGGNFSVRRVSAINLGGFDENFAQVAYRFEAEFAHRVRSSGQRIYFEPRACLHHLKAVSGGTRAYGDYLTTWRPDHAVGAYYSGLRTGVLREFVRRPFRAMITRHHLRRPWLIPATLLAEVRGMLWALRLHLAGPRLITPERNASDD